MSLNQFAFPKETLTIKRSRFDLSWGHTTTLKSGKCVPVYVQEILPGDTFKIDFNHVTRMMSPVAPIFGNIFLDVHFFFVPNRLTCNYAGKTKVWERVHGENTTGWWANTEEMTLQTIPLTSNASMSVANYMGIAIDGGDIDDLEVNTYIFKAYTLIWNEYFRDQNLEAPKDIDTYGLQTSLDNFELSALYSGTYGVNNYAHADSCLPAAKLHDYFTSCLPYPMKSFEQVPIIDGVAPVEFDGSGMMVDSGATTGTPTVSTISGNKYLLDNDASFMKITNAQVDLSEVVSNNIMALRRNFAIQRVLERDNYGTRYRELLKAHYGTSLPDFTAQVPEHLGSYRTQLNITQVLQTSNNTGDASAITGNHIGSLGAFSNTAGSKEIVEKSFREFGVIIGIAIIRNEQQYSSGLPKMFSRKRRFDFYYPEFANLGEQAVLNKEISIESSTQSAGEGVFGYQPAWQEYRFRNNFVSGNFAPEAGDETLTHWTLTNDFSSSAPTLSAAFIHQDPATIGNVLYDQDTETQFYMDCFFKVTATRPMPVNPLPGGLTGAW